MKTAHSDSERNLQLEATASYTCTESWKILINCMISEDAYWSTIDLEDFYLGTPLPLDQLIVYHR
jgi:hypothetical protein